MNAARRGSPKTSAPAPPLPPARPGPPGPLGSFGAALLTLVTARASGVLHVTGEPGGTIYLTDGGITAITTPGAPDPEAVLLRSGRVPEADWSAAFAAAASAGQMGAELVRRKLIGAGELEVVLRMTLADAMFVLAAGQLGESRLEAGQADVLLPLDPPADTQWLLSEAARRIGVLSSLPNRIVHDRDRVAAVTGAGQPTAGPSDGRAEIIALANGRRTARDMAFVLGHGVYSVTLQLSRMWEAGLLVIGSSRKMSARGSSAGPGVTAPPDVDAAVTAPVPALPRRRRTAAGTSAPRNADRESDRPSVLRLLRGSGSARQPSKETS